MQDFDLQAGLTATAPDRGAALLRLAENQWFDRKSPRIAAKDLAITLAALANAEGGTVVIGLEKGRVEGVAGADERANGWRQAGIDYCEPPVKVTWQEVGCVRHDGRPDRLLLAEVAPSPLVHATKADEVYLRVGDENRRLTFTQRQELLYDKGQAQFDGTAVPGAEYGDLQPALIASYARAIHSPDSRRALVARGLLASDGGVTVAGWLLFAEEPQSRYPSAYVRVIRYQGTTRETGSRQQITADVRCEGPIPHMIDTALRAVRRWQPKRRVLGREGRFVLEGLIPQDAWLEGIVNAVVHRSYSLGGDHIRVELFDDRIEITSPGGFPGLSHPGKLPEVTRFARNPRIARACADLQLGQELGEGIRRMFEEMRSRGLADPLYAMGHGSVRLVLTSLVADGHVLGQFRAEYLTIMDVIRHGRGLGTGDVAEAVGISRPTAKLRLRKLQELGFIEWVGKSPHDPRAYWRQRSE
jgi:ATP-dependent DNA helicase RecG